MTIEQVKAEYKKLAKKYHPDMKPHGCKIIMQEINKEYESVCKNHSTDSKMNDYMKDFYKNQKYDYDDWSDVWGKSKYYSGNYYKKPQTETKYYTYRSYINETTMSKIILDLKDYYKPDFENLKIYLHKEKEYKNGEISLILKFVGYSDDIMSFIELIEMQIHNNSSNYFKRRFV
jgi:DnaJ-class molecular chaperone